MPTEPTPPTISDVVRRAVEVCDPAGEEPATADLLARFEDRDEPITSLADPEADLADAAALDEGVAGVPEVMTIATATYLAHRRDQIDAERRDLLRLVARAEFDDGVPEPVRDWLRDQGVEA